MATIAAAAIDQTPAIRRVSQEQAELIAEHAALLVGLAPDIAREFLATLYSEPDSASLLAETNRQALEESLISWWIRTVTGPIDQAYWTWIATIGLIHLSHHVPISTMLAMTDLAADYAAGTLADQAMPEPQRTTLVAALRRVSAMTGVIVGHAYEHAVSSALFEVAGMPEALLSRLRDQEIAQALALARRS